MNEVFLNRRQCVLGGAAAIGAVALPGYAWAARRIGPGGFSPDRLASIPGILQSYVDDNSAVGFVTLVYREGQMAQVNAVGMRDREAGLPMTREHDLSPRLDDQARHLRGRADSGGSGQDRSQ
jgi:hypothetical protein